MSKVKTLAAHSTLQINFLNTFDSSEDCLASKTIISGCH